MNKKILAPLRSYSTRRVLYIYNEYYYNQFKKINYKLK